MRMAAMLLADLPDPGLARVARNAAVSLLAWTDLGPASRACASPHAVPVGFAPPKRDARCRHRRQGDAVRVKARARRSYLASKP